MIRCAASGSVLTPRTSLASAIGQTMESFSAKLEIATTVFPDDFLVAGTTPLGSGLQYDDAVRLRLSEHLAHEFVGNPGHGDIFPSLAVVGRYSGAGIAVHVIRLEICPPR